jgi:hypothetical protein
VIPVRPSPYDLRALGRTVALAQEQSKPFDSVITGARQSPQTQVSHAFERPIAWVDGRGGLCGSGGSRTGTKSANHVRAIISALSFFDGRQPYWRSRYALATRSLIERGTGTTQESLPTRPSAMASRHRA